MFFALKGANFNGNLFAKEAIRQGALFAVVDEPEAAGDENIVLVDDVLKTLQELASYHRKQLNIPIIGITGTNGKTTTKELVKSVLESTYKVYATQGNLNNHIGVPLTLLSMGSDIEIGIVEMGANHPGEIRALCNIADPDCGLITNVGKAHLEGFGSFEGVKSTKSELYRHLEGKQGTVFINSDNSHLKGMLTQGAIKYSYGKSDDNKVVFGSFLNGDFLGFSCAIDGCETEIKTNLVGRYNLENAMAAVTIGNYFKVTSNRIVQAIANYFPTNNRSQLEVTSKNKVLFDAYNANPSSMEVALLNFKDMEGVNKTVIFGEMKELGVDSAMEHKKLVDALFQIEGLRIILVGENYRELVKDSEVDYYHNVDELVSLLKANPLEDALVLVKGSRSNRLEKLKEVL